jgi:GH24 family phage-related lysozyme (muramidase)
MNSNKPSEKTLNLLLKYETGGGKAYYDKYLSKFTWPGGASGPTIGIGIDCGYYTPQELDKMFSFLEDEQLDAVKEASGKKGSAGKDYAKVLRKQGIIVDWEKAEEIFTEYTWPKFTRLAERAFPDLSNLHPDAYGAIVSIVFNRGTAMKGDSRKEMRNIRAYVPEKNYKKIAQEVRNMKRLWVGKNLDGLLERRDAEALLIESII